MYDRRMKRNATECNIYECNTHRAHLLAMAA